MLRSTRKWRKTTFNLFLWNPPHRYIVRAGIYWKISTCTPTTSRIASKAKAGHTQRHYSVLRIICFKARLNITSSAPEWRKPGKKLYKYDHPVKYIQELDWKQVKFWRTWTQNYGSSMLRVVEGHHAPTLMIIFFKLLKVQYVEFVFHNLEPHPFF